MAVIFRRITTLVLLLLCSGALLVAAAQDQAKEFKSLDQLPPAEPFPAARLLIGAYVVVIVGLFLYLVSVARRLSAVQREVERLEADVKRTPRT